MYVHEIVLQHVLVPTYSDCLLLRCLLQVDLNSVIGSLHSPFASRLAHKVDVLVFNPPYVPTEEEEGEAAQSDANISAAWAGGSIGMTTTEAVIHAAPVSIQSGLCCCRVEADVGCSSRHCSPITDASIWWLFSRIVPWRSLDKQRPWDCLARSVLCRTFSSLCKLAEAILKVALKRRAGGEILYVLRFRRDSTPTD